MAMAEAGAVEVTGEAVEAVVATTVGATGVIGAAALAAPPTPLPGTRRTHPPLRPPPREAPTQVSATANLGRTFQE